MKVYSLRVRGGGSWFDPPPPALDRRGNTPLLRLSTLGFRLVRKR